jgi:hypothetical protein
MEPAPELAELLQQYYAASGCGDTAVLGRLVARDPAALVIGTDDSEWWQGGDEIIGIWSAAWHQRGGLPVQGSRPQAFRSGAVGWVADRAVWRMPDGRTVPFRLTAVFCLEAATWRLVQAHFSLGVPNETVAPQS